MKLYTIIYAGSVVVVGCFAIGRGWPFLDQAAIVTAVMLAHVSGFAKGVFER